MNIIKANRLNLGETIGVIAPSGCVDSDIEANLAKDFFENLGYKVVFGKNIFNQKRYLAGTDEEKLEDLHNFFADDNIKAISCLRGGYGCTRLVNKIDYNLIRNNPKIFAGYSDITVLCAMFLKRAGLITYHAPLFQSDFGKKNPSTFTFTKFLTAFTQFKGEELQAKKIYKRGIAEGITFGGNLSALTSLCGIDFIPDEKFIFFTEDLNEPVYKIDKMFSQLLNIKEFKENLQGIVLGDFLNTDNEQWLEDFITEMSENLNIPILGGFPITHNKDKITIPVGTNAKINDDIFCF